MKAAVLYNFGEVPQYEDFPDPIPNQEEVLINVKAVALENVDKAMGDGTHFASHQFFSKFPAIVGITGIGELPDGQLVGFGGMKSPYGSMAEKAVVSIQNTVPIPEGIDAAIAASLPKSALTPLFSLRWGAGIQPGETVLINGATSVSGKLAVQIAKLLGAGRIIATGRNDESLKQMETFGADTIIDLKQSDEQLIKMFKRETKKGIDIILDYLWGHVTELLIRSLVPEELNFAKRRARLIQIGEKAGSTISLSADSLRTSGLEIIGAGARLTPDAIQKGTNQVWDWIQNDKLHIDIEKIPLQGIEKAWECTDYKGKRIVIVI